MHAGQLLGDFPQPPPGLLVVRLAGGGDHLRIPALLAAPARPDVGTAGQLSGRRGVQGGQRAHVGALGEQAVADPHERLLVEAVGRCELEVGARVPGVGGQAQQRAGRRGGTALELEAEHQVGQLGLAVGAPPAVLPLALQVVEVHRAAPVHRARHRDHARRRRLEQRAQQQPGEREVAEVVGAELALEPVGCLPARGGHDARVVDQQIEAVPRAENRPANARTDARSARSSDATATPALGASERSVPPPDRAWPIADRQHDFAPARADARWTAEAAVRSGDDRQAPALVRDVSRRPLSRLARRRLTAAP